MADTKKGTPRISDRTTEDRRKIKELLKSHPPISEKTFKETIEKCVKRSQKMLAERRKEEEERDRRRQFDSLWYKFWRAVGSLIDWLCFWRR